MIAITTPVHENAVPEWALEQVALYRRQLVLPERVTDWRIYQRMVDCRDDASEYVTRERLRRLRDEIPWTPKPGAKGFMPPRLVTRALDEIDVLYWIETNAHHEGDASNPNWLALRGYDTELRIPMQLFRRESHYESTRYPFDTRMYRATAYGNTLLNRAGLRPLITAIQQKRS